MELIYIFGETNIAKQKKRIHIKFEGEKLEYFRHKKAYKKLSVKGNQFALWINQHVFRKYFKKNIY